ncbi:CdaR family protein [Desulfurobacterium atlanticum]|uniref:YbbR-like protein n=1 Tax=Desulfurobacterium atlanticum TaxID=240169 RepID=A0A238Y6R1_9BACT|nr:YbbR-like domain-containing protein [Desulfurobacterium atlanticum]SNR66700.1 YbbR-like protein [Desulfurobacterium atlanticum]
MKRVIDYIFYNFHYKLLAIVFAFLLWFLAVKQETVVSRISLPLKIEVSSDFYVVSYSPSEIEVEIEGAKRSVAMLKEEGKAVLKVPDNFLASLNREITVPLNQDTVTVFPQLQDVTVKKFYPDKVKIKLEKLVAKLLPVKVIFSGKFKKRYKAIFVSPDYVTVYLPQSEVKSVRFVETEPVDVDSISNRARVVLKIVSPYKVFPAKINVVIERRR